MGYRRYANCFFLCLKGLLYPIPGRVAQWVTCLARDVSLTADPGVVSSIPARSHTFVEIDHEIISKVILLPSAESFKKGCCQLQVKVCAQSTGLLLSNVNSLCKWKTSVVPDQELHFFQRGYVILKKLFTLCAYYVEY